jgi:hypothetical protein
MTKPAKTYIGSVIAAGGLVLVASLANWSSPDPLRWAIYLVLAVLASVVKLRLPGLDGSYSLGFLLVLYGVAHLSLPETLLAACAGAVASSLLNTKKRSSPIQVLFNIGNVAISVSTCFLLSRIWLASGITHYLPAVLAVAACAYFIVNTVLVSGVLSLLQGKRLAGVCSEWYVWSFPYYLIGVALVGLLPSEGRVAPREAWLILLPLVYLVRFFLGLLKWHGSSAAFGDRSNGALPRAAGRFVVVVVGSGLLLLFVAAINWRPQNPGRFVAYLALATCASTLKIRLPRMRGTLTPAFVLLLASIADLSWEETVLMAAVLGLVQAVWRCKQRPTLAQVLFNPACLALSAACAYGLSRAALAPWLGNSAVGVLLIGTLVLYGCNTLLVGTVLALVEGKPLGSACQLCCFWSLPYYLVGAAVAGIMVATSRTADWPTSLLVLPLMGLVYVSYRVHLQQAVDRSVQAPA